MILPSRYSGGRSSRALYTLLSVATQYVPKLIRSQTRPDHGTVTLVRREETFDPHDPKDIVFVVLIPVLVLLSGLFAGLTLGYMSLDETQLNVLSISGTPKQREYAQKILPIRKNGHLLLVTLLLANMISNETLPIIFDNVVGGGVVSVVVSTALIVIFAEILPQSLFTRHGLFLGAKMAGLTRCLIFALGIISWPVAKFLEFVLGPHHGIIYRRGELKELIALHSQVEAHGGDLKTDTVTIIGATLDLQEKVVRQAMTPIKDVFMLSIDAKLDFELLKKICQTGHSRVPVYEEIEVPIAPQPGGPRTRKVKKILGILLVKHCVLLDPNDAIPIRKIPLNKVPYVPQDEPLLGILDKFQEGRSHMAIVSRVSHAKAASVKNVVKQSLTQRLRQRVGMDSSSSSSSSSSSDSSSDEEEHFTFRRIRRGRKKTKDIEEGTEDGDATLKEDSEKQSHSPQKPKDRKARVRHESSVSENSKTRRASFHMPKVAAGMTSISQLEQSMPADAVLAKEGAAEFLQNFDPAVDPLGIITLEDVVEELIGEEIYDEFNTEGAHGDPYVPPAQPQAIQAQPSTTEAENAPSPVVGPPQKPILKPLSLKGFNFLRSRSAPPSPRDISSAIIPEKLSATTPSNDPPLTTPVPMTPKPPSRSNSLQNEGTVDTTGSDDMRNRAVPSIPAVVMEQPSPVSTGLSSIPPVSATATAASAPATRSSSPAPSLETILLGKRQRRLQGVTSIPAVGGGTASRSGSMSGKGPKFKSSPLVSGGTGSGAKVSERVKESDANDGDTEGFEDVFEDDTIPDSKDKDGPDKE